MTTAILIIVIFLALWSVLTYVALFNEGTHIVEEMKRHYDRETVRILTAMYNKDAFVEAMERGEEIEL